MRVAMFMNLDDICAWSVTDDIGYKHFTIRLSSNYLISTKSRARAAEPAL